MTAASDNLVNPYVGPRPFRPEEKNLFFGRDWEADELVALVVAHPASLLYAQSGAGKSSLLNARIVPKLEAEENCEVLPIARVRGDIPPEIKADRIKNIYIFNTLLGWADETGTNPADLLDRSLADFLQRLPRRSDGEGYPVLRAIIFDQFEELFTFYPARWPDREGFFVQIGQALAEDAFLRVLFVIREDYLAQLDPYVNLLPEQLRARFRLERLRKTAALAAIEGPLVERHRSFAPGAAEALVNELLRIRVEDRRGQVMEAPGEFVEPVQLQVVCQSLWEDLPPDVTEITESHLKAFGNVDQALTRFYDRAIKTAAQQTGQWEWRLRFWFEREFLTPAGTRSLVYRGARKTGGVPNRAVDLLESQHLIRGERRAGSHWYELTHDRLIGPILQSNRDWWMSRLKKWGPIAAGSILVLVVTLAILTGVFASAAGASQLAQQVAAATGTAVGEVAAEAARTAQAAQIAVATSTAVAENVNRFVDSTQATADAAQSKQATAQAVAAAPAGSSLLPAEVSTAIAATEVAARAAAATAGVLLSLAETTTPTPTETVTPTPTLTPEPSVSPSATEEVTTPQPLTWPPNERIAFVSTRLSAGDLYLMNGDGSHLERLTESGAFDPSYSPGRNQIVFANLRDRRVSLYTIDLDGSNERNIGGRQEDNWDPSFSFDGRQVAFVSSRNGGQDIYVMNEDGSNVRRLTDHPEKDYAPAWSPDGRRIAFVSDRTGQADIWLMNADGSNQVRLTDNRAQDVSPAWSPRGDRLVFVSTRDGNAELYVMDTSGRNQRNLTNSVFDENFPAWSLDGNWLAFSRFTTDNEILIMTVTGSCPPELSRELIIETTKEGNCVINLSNDSNADWAPIWLP